MISERASLLIEPQQSIDEELFSRLVEQQGTMSVSEALLPDATTLAEQKQAFYDSGMQQAPDLRPTTVDVDQIESRNKALIQLGRTGIDEDTDPTVAQLYRWRINELVAENRIVQAAATGDTRRFEVYNKFVYGTPSTEVFRATAGSFRADAQASLDHDNPNVREAAAEVLAVVDGIPESETSLTPSPELFGAVRELHYRKTGFYALLLSGVELPDSGTVGPDVGEPALERILHNLEAGYSRAENPTGKSWAISHARKEFLGPLDYKLPVNRFIGLPAGHEAGSHILEYVNGMRSKLQLMAIGLDRYEAGNEGRALLREQVVYPDIAEFSKLIRWQDVLRRHFAISLATGLKDDAVDFPSVYKAVNAIDKLWERKKNPDDPDAADAKAHTRTWSLLERVLKGTDGTGGAYRKDIVYLEGNVASWKAAEADVYNIESGDLGKYDIANDRHTEALGKLGVLETRQ